MTRAEEDDVVFAWIMSIRGDALRQAALDEWICAYDLDPEEMEMRAYLYRDENQREILLMPAGCGGEVVRT